MQGRAAEPGWQALLTSQWALPLGVLLGGVLLHSMNVLLTATVLPSIVIGIGGADLMSWPTTACRKHHGHAHEHDGTGNDSR